MKCYPFFFGLTEGFEKYWIFFFSLCSAYTECEKKFWRKIKGYCKSFDDKNFVNNSFSTSDSVNCLSPIFTFLSIFDLRNIYKTLCEEFIRKKLINNDQSRSKSLIPFKFSYRSKRSIDQAN